MRYKSMSHQVPIRLLVLLLGFEGIQACKSDGSSPIDPDVGASNASEENNDFSAGDMFSETQSDVLVGDTRSTTDIQENPRLDMRETAEDQDVVSVSDSRHERDSGEPPVNDISELEDVRDPNLDTDLDIREQGGGTDSDIDTPTDSASDGVPDIAGRAGENDSPRIDPDDSGSDRDTGNEATLTGSMSWTMPPTGEEVELCPQWKALDWKPLAYNPCDTPTATAEDQAALAAIPSACPSYTSELLNVLAAIDLSSDFDIYAPQSDVFYQFGRISSLHSPSVALIAELDLGDDPKVLVSSYAPVDKVEPIKQTVMRTDLLGASSGILHSSSIGDTESRFVPYKPMWSPAQSHVLALLEVDDEPAGLNKSWDIFSFSPLKDGIPKAVQAVGPLAGIVYGSQSNATGMILASAAHASELAVNPCVDLALRRIDIDGGLKWVRYFGQWFGAPDGKTQPVASSVRAVPIEGCGYAISFINIYYSEVPVAGSSIASPHVVTTYYLTREGHIVHRSDYHMGKYLFGGQYAQTVVSDGEDIWIAWRINGLALPTPISTGHKTAVLRLGIDGKAKEFSIFSTWGFPHSMAITSDKLVVLTSDMGQVVVLDPGLCPLVSYFGFFETGDTGLTDVTQLDNTTFAAHDTRRVFIFDVPIIKEWQAQNPPTP